MLLLIPSARKEREPKEERECVSGEGETKEERFDRKQREEGYGLFSFICGEDQPPDQ